MLSHVLDRYLTMKLGYLYLYLDPKYLYLYLYLRHRYLKHHCRYVSQLFDHFSSMFVRFGITPNQISVRQIGIDSEEGN